jgi:AcrR family transcriptional regulator
MMTALPRRVKAPLTRAEKAHATRRRICEAARERFIESGYTGTTMADVAADAGVAVQTVYFVFHTKADLLRAVFDSAVLGDLDAPPPDRQDWYREMLEEPDGRRAIERFVDGNAAIMHRVAPLVPLFQSSGVAEVTGLYADRERMRWDGFHGLSKTLERRRALAVPAREATDVLFALMSPQLHALLSGRGWSDRRWRAWTTRTLQMQLLRDQPPSEAGGAPAAKAAAKP